MNTTPHTPALQPGDTVTVVSDSAPFVGVVVTGTIGTLHDVQASAWVEFDAANGGDALPHGGRWYWLSSLTRVSEKDTMNTQHIPDFQPDDTENPLVPTAAEAARVAEGPGRPVGRDARYQKLLSGYAAKFVNDTEDTDAEPSDDQLAAVLVHCARRPKSGEYDAIRVYVAYWRAVRAKDGLGDDPRYWPYTSVASLGFGL